MEDYPTLGDTANLDLLRYQRRLDCAVSASQRRKARQAGELLEGSRRYLVQMLLRCCFVVGLHLGPKEQVVLAQLAASPYRELGAHPQPAGLKSSLLLSKPTERTYHLSQPSSSECLLKCRREARPIEQLAAIQLGDELWEATDDARHPLLPISAYPVVYDILRRPRGQTARGRRGRSSGAGRRRRRRSGHVGGIGLDKSITDWYMVNFHHSREKNGKGSKRALVAALYVGEDRQ